MALRGWTFGGWRGLILLLLAYALTGARADCAPYPVALRAGNVSLSNGKVARGVEMAIGEPEQTFAFMPQFDRNGILLYSSETLNNGERSKDSFVSFRGGSYNAIDSTTQQSSTLDISLGDPAEPKVSSIADKIKLNTNITLDSMQMGIAASDWNTQGYKALMSFGLGTKSTLLRVLRSSDKIASRSWGFFWGFGFGMPSQLDGNFIFGGYDRAKVTGERYTAKLTLNDPQCETQLVVEISDLTLNFYNNTDVSIFPKGSPRPVMRTCIKPFVPVLMTLPLYPYFSNWLDVTQQHIGMMKGTTGYYYWNQMYKPEYEAYTGGLTISLSSGLNISISNEKLVVPNVYIDRETGDTVSNGTESVMLLTSLQSNTANHMPNLGSQFLAAAYLQVNQDAGQFSLWKANPTPKEDLVAVDAADAEVSEFCTAAPNATTSTNSLDKGTIAGIAVGAVAGVAIVVGLTVWLLKRKRSAVASKAPDQPAPAYDGKQDMMQQNTVPMVYEIGSSQQHTAPAVYEMGQESRPRSELA
ncbi:hypothetical protein CPLU01_14071 [Colletotrichum plurivorum]|uniref:Peptidase A1 domain-containing protein n=1 Tax=Colletotrichum plurivorum TaxID=2175906 RepID=A0A8H6N125_9PEZI|nr:hypothetical protein CPLU01_14071 [Colletotrichum plurivorum]